MMKKVKCVKLMNEKYKKIKMKKKKKKKKKNKGNKIIKNKNQKLYQKCTLQCFVLNHRNKKL